MRKNEYFVVSPHGLVSQERMLFGLRRAAHQALEMRRRSIEARKRARLASERVVLLPADEAAFRWV